MSERLFRLILGAMIFIALTLALLLDNQIPVYIVLGIISFEAITNWRIPTIVTRIRHGKNYKEFIDKSTIISNSKNTSIMKMIEAERFLRIVVLVFICTPYFIHIQEYDNYVAFTPWFVATMLTLAGVTNICPMVMFLRFTGMR